MPVQHFRRKPDRRDNLGLIAARYKAGEPLDDLLLVAAHVMDGELAECVLPSETILLVRWLGEHGPSPEWRYTVVRDGKWLAYSEGYDNLLEDSDGDLAQWYEPAEAVTR